MESKDNMKIYASQIKRLAYSKAPPENYDSGASKRVPYKKKENTGVLLARKKQGNKTPKHRGAHN